MKRVICVLGLPGMGKTWLSKELARILGGSFFHLPRVVGHLLPARVRDLCRRYARSFPGVTGAFLRVVEADERPVAVLDGFPRTLRTLHALVRFAQARRWTVEVLALRAPLLRGVGLSVVRAGPP